MKLFAIRSLNEGDALPPLGERKLRPDEVPAPAPAPKPVGQGVFQDPDGKMRTDRPVPPAMIGNWKMHYRDCEEPSEPPKSSGMTGRIPYYAADFSGLEERVATHLGLPALKAGDSAASWHPSSLLKV
jgi:hypothetical protein